jgi:hypothetical protein
LQDAVVNDRKVQISKLRVSRDFSKWVGADLGVNSGEQVILNPPGHSRRRHQGRDPLRRHRAGHIGW